MSRLEGHYLTLYEFHLRNRVVTLKARILELEEGEELMQDDIGDLLEALGDVRCARPRTPHEVLQECIERVRRLRTASHED